jgi:cell division protein FtsI/penicillin-binding protein 2
MVGDTTWTPKSTDKDEWIGQTVTLKWGLTKSSNNISAYLMKQYGPNAMVEMMRKMGVGSFLDPVYPLCVGSADISVYEKWANILASNLGMDKDTVLERMRTKLPHKFKASDGAPFANGAIFDIDNSSKKCKSVKRIKF